MKEEAAHSKVSHTYYAYAFPACLERRCPIRSFFTAEEEQPVDRRLNTLPRRLELPSQITTEMDREALDVLLQFAQLPAMDTGGGLSGPEAGLTEPPPPLSGRFPERPSIPCPLARSPGLEGVKSACTTFQAVPRYKILFAQKGEGFLGVSRLGVGAYVALVGDGGVVVFWDGAVCMSCLFLGS